MCKTCIYLTHNLDDIKICCIDCGLVQEDEGGKPYIRSITQFRNMENKPSISVLVGEKLQNQANKFLKRDLRHAVDHVIVNQSEYPPLYYEYIEFLRNHENEILPKKQRKKTIFGIYGEHRQIILDWCAKVINCE